MQLIDHSGRRFGRWLVLRRAESPDRHTRWLCRCDCGATAAVKADHLTRGASQSCGCLTREVNHARAIHGESQRSREYRAWSHAKGRCYCPTTERYPSYGGRGITMCDRWRHDFLAFLTDMGRCPPGFSIDRINTNGDYEPGNCRWADKSTQANNVRTNRVVAVAGQSMTLVQAARGRGVDYKTVHQRVTKGGLSVTDALRPQFTRQERRCEHCGAPYTPGPRSAKQKYCAAACNRAAWTARHAT